MPPKRAIIHAVEKHHDPDAGERRRKEAAHASWEVLYRDKGVIPSHYWRYDRSALALGDARDLPYLKDCLKYAMRQAEPQDIIMFTNDDVALHPDLPDLLRFHVALYDACAGQRLDFNQVPGTATLFAGGSPCVGRDMFAFTRKWLDEHWAEIPDFLLGASEWDWCLLAMIRNEKGIQTTNANIGETIFPAEIPRGYLAHQGHTSIWMRPENVNAAPSQVHNRNLFKSWLAVHIQDFRLSTYPGPMPKPAIKDIIVRRTNSLGDVLAATSVADALINQGFDVTFQAHPNTHPILRGNPRIKVVQEPQGTPHVNLDGAYENHPERATKHFADLFYEQANRQLEPMGINIGVPQDYAPRIMSNPEIRAQVLELMQPWPKPWVMICPRSQSFKHRSVPVTTWAAAAGGIHGTKFWLGFDGSPSSNIVNLKCRQVDRLIEFIGLSDLLISTDTGPAHIALALGVPAVIIGQSSDPVLHFSDQRDWVSIYPHWLPCLNCQDSVCRINADDPGCQYVKVDQIVEAANARLRCVTTDDVSAIICVYQPDIARLNRCIQHVGNQVEEIVVVANLDTPWPLEGAIRHHKIKYVQRPFAGIGYSKNANYGVRHSNGKTLLMLNDDVQLEGNVVAMLKQELAPDVAAVTHTLRYPNGTIQYAGKYRNGHDIGFGHIDHRAMKVRYQSPVETESFCGASMLIRRKAYYEVSGYSEIFELYSEDDALAMALRQKGWRLIFTPHARGIHEEHCSTNKVPNLNQILQRSSALFAKKWGWYFQKNNAEKGIGTFT